jgi:hypothetical protein
MQDSAWLTFQETGRRSIIRLNRIAEHLQMKKHKTTTLWHSRWQHIG